MRARGSTEPRLSLLSFYLPSFFLFSFRYYTYANTQYLHRRSARLFRFNDLHEYASATLHSRAQVYNSPHFLSISCPLFLISLRHVLLFRLHHRFSPVSRYLYRLLSRRKKLSSSHFRNHSFLSSPLCALKRNIKLSIKRLRKNPVDYRRAPRFAPLTGLSLWNFSC